MRDDETRKLANFIKMAESGFISPVYFLQGSVGSGKSYLIENAFEQANESFMDEGIGVRQSLYVFNSM